MKIYTLFFIALVLLSCNDDDRNANDGGNSDTDTDSDSDSDTEGCPDDMIHISEKNACIDSFEFTNSQYAAFLSDHGNTCGVTECRQMGEVSNHIVEDDLPLQTLTVEDIVEGDDFEVAEGVGEFPVSWVTWYGAKDACLWAGKTLCPWDVWYWACSNGLQWHFPYGGSTGGVESVEGYFADYVKGACSDDDEGDREVGSKNECQGGYEGVFDLAGNIAEWGGTRDLKGYWWFMGNSYSAWWSLDEVNYVGAGCLFPTSPVDWHVDEPPIEIDPNEDPDAGIVHPPTAEVTV